MKLRTWITWLAAVTVVALSPVATAQAQHVTFSDLNDAVPARFFDAAASAPDAVNPNKLIIGFNSGFDTRTWKYAGFTASTASFYSSAATDTISFRVTAPVGFYVSKITYTQRGAGLISRSGSAAGSANWVVDDNAADLGLFGTNPTLSRTADLTSHYRAMVPVSITASLFAFAPPLLGSATITIASAEVLVEILPCPVGNLNCEER